MIQVNALEYYQMKYDILMEHEDVLTPEQKDLENN
jgi:Spy/CpxP family protein refolding chaperone